MISAGTFVFRFVFFSFVSALAYASSHDATNEETHGPGAFHWTVCSSIFRRVKIFCVCVLWTNS